MRKFLEVLMDDDGALHMSTDFTFVDDIDNPPADIAQYAKEADKMHRTAIRAMVETMWKDRNLNVSKAIRYLSMAEVMACAEPYDNAEHLWSALMFDYIPYYEKFANKLKTPYGYDPTHIIRPITMGNPSFFKTGIMPLGKLPPFDPGKYN